MCGRFAYIPNKELLHHQFQVTETQMLPVRYNIPPSSKVLFLCALDEGQLAPLYLKWGLVPSWAKDKKIGGGITNARAESVFEKPAFRNLMKSKRGIMVMTGFYEWHHHAGVKQPYYIKHIKDEFLAVAAIWDTWQQDNEVLHTCCLITTQSNAMMQSVHHRMPVILPKEHYEPWLNNERYNPEQLMSIMRPYKALDLECYPVTCEMNRAAFDVPAAIAPIIIHK